MVQINFGQREVSCKVVFYGPGMSGKTTNLEIIHKKAPKEAVGEMVSIATETDRTLYFDFLPLDLGQVAGMRTKFQLYTVPGQIYYNATRKLVLQGVDGVIFVADSNPDKMAENLESLQNLRDNLAEIGMQIDDINAGNYLPLVLQYNKRDLPTVLSIADMDAKLNSCKVPVHEAVARDGKGVFTTLKEISRLVIEKLNKENAPAAGRRRTASTLTPGGTPALPIGANPAPLPNPTPPQPVPVVQQAPPVQMPAPAAPAQAHHPVTGTIPRQGQPANAPPRPNLPPRAPMPPPPMDAARAQHLAKPKPPAVDQAAKFNPELVTTDPGLRQYREQRQGGALRMALFAMVALVIIGLILAISVLFVPPVRALLPMPLQKALAGDAAPATTSDSKP